MKDFTLCPYCNTGIPISKQTYAKWKPSLETSNFSGSVKDTYASCIDLEFWYCLSCKNYIISAKGIGEKVSSVDLQMLPISRAKHFPDYVPPFIRADYEEACSIVNLSPKASATLARRCLQGMIRDYWNIKSDNLYQEISMLHGKIPENLWLAIDNLRKLGNIGAHMEKDTNIIIDIEANEATALLMLIETLIDNWYIDRKNTQNLFSYIESITENKQQLRKSKE